MSSTSPQTPKELAGAFLSQLRAEYEAAVTRAEEAAIESERLTKEAEKLAGALEAAERFVAQVFVPAVPSADSAEQDALAQSPAFDRPSTGFAVVPLERAVSLVRNESWTKRLRGMTQKQALVAIAEHEGGILDVKKARDIFIESGVTESKNPRAVYGVIHTILRGSDRFEKIGEGAFRLISPSPAMVGQSVMNDWGVTAK
jgi:hypothetical protein